MNKNLLLSGILILTVSFNGINAFAKQCWMDGPGKFAQSICEDDLPNKPKEPLAKKPTITQYHAEANPMRHLEGAQEAQEDIETIFATLEGDYAKIDVRTSNQAIDTLQGDSIDKADEMAERMEKALGNYNPPALVQLALYFKEEGQTQKAYRLFSLAYMRAKIDVQASNDRSTRDIPGLLLGTFAKHAPYSDVTPASERTIKGLQAYLKVNRNKTVELDLATPRSYDTRWPLLQGMGKYTQAPINVATGATYDAIISEVHETWVKENV